MSETYQVCVVGAGLAGAECAWQLAKFGVGVVLIEMRPLRFSPAHSTKGAAELVCSNSLRSADVGNAVGLLKEEMAALDSLIIKAAYKSRVPAGSALAVDRELFSNCVSETLKAQSNITRKEGVVTAVESSECGVELCLESGERVLAKHCVLATGPLTDDSLAQWIANKTDSEYLYFYDSIAPVIEADSIDMSKAFKASRYNKDETHEGDYINCPLNDAAYESLMTAIETAELAEVHDFDKAQFFEGCLPIEEMVRRGRETLRFGPMKPVGLTNPHSPEERAHAVVQLRQDNLHATLYNMVGFQTRMKWGEQKRVFRTIPGLEGAEFVRMGSMHRNTYVCSPVVLQEGFALKNCPRVHLAGQITGCEGYVESAAVGLYVGAWLGSRLVCDRDLPRPPATTALGALLRHILQADPQDYQPMNINFGLFEPIEGRVKKFEKKMALLKRAVGDFRLWFYDRFLPDSFLGPAA